MPVEKCPAFILEYKFFDQLSNANDIALYSFISRMSGIAYAEADIMRELKLTKRQLDKSFAKLVKIGFLTLASE